MSVLPSTPSVASVDLPRERILIEGGPGSGKTTFLAGVPNALYLDTERSADYRSGLMKVQVDRWETFTTAVAELVRTQHGFETVIIDTLNSLYDIALDAHQSKDPRLTYKRAKDELIKAITAIERAGMGIYCSVHTEAKDLLTAEGGITKLRMALAPSISRLFERWAAFIGHLDIDYARRKNGSAGRILYTEDGETYLAKSRWPFLPDRISIPETAGWAAFASLFPAAAGIGPETAAELQAAIYRVSGRPEETIAAILEKYQVDRLADLTAGNYRIIQATIEASRRKTAAPAEATAPKAEQTDRAARKPAAEKAPGKTAGRGKAKARQAPEAEQHDSGGELTPEELAAFEAGAPPPAKTKQKTAPADEEKIAGGDSFDFGYNVQQEPEPDLLDTEDDDAFEDFRADNL